jgi:hypothetical protein
MFNDQTVVEASKGGDLEDVFEEIANQLMRMAATKMSRAETQRRRGAKTQRRKEILLFFL